MDQASIVSGSNHTASARDFLESRFRDSKMNPSAAEEDFVGSLARIRDLHYALNQIAIVSITDLKGDITYANELFGKVMKVSPSEIVGKNHRVFNSGFHDREFFKNLWDTLLAGEVWRGEVRDRASDGSFVWLKSTIIPFLDERGRPYQYVCLRTDITEERNRAEARESERAHREYVGRLAGLGEIAGNLAHEIRNPLAAILLNTQSMSRIDRAGAATPERLVRYLETIERTAKRIERIIDNVHRLSRDGTHDRFEPVNLVELVEETLGFCRARFEKGSVHLSVDYSASKVEDLACRPVQISQVLLNLLNNAFDAVQGLADAWVKLRVLDDPEGVTIEVTDSGAGVPESIRARIMDPYFTTKEAGKGTGLGLSISRRIVEEHRGNLQLAPGSNPTTFRLRLPRGVARETESRDPTAV